MFKKPVIFIVVFFSVLALSLQGQYNVLHTFAGPTADGEQPWGSLIIKGSTLYGMSRYGGADNKGAIFKIGVVGTGFALLHSFAGGASDGREPFASLTLYNGKLYGMTAYGGLMDDGVIFRINTDGTGFTLLHTFTGTTTDGSQPHGSLILYSGNFYGLTSKGGSSGSGTVFKISPSGSGFKLLHSFAGGATDGAEPLGSLKVVGTKLYGMTGSGGASDSGTIFRISPSGTGFGVLHSFAGGVSDGSEPGGGSLAASSSTLFGMTTGGGASNWGTVFKINTNGSGFALLHSFSTASTDGTAPLGSVIFAGSKLYGLTQLGGAGYYGTIFVINSNGTGFKILHSFDFDEGAYPYGELLRVVSTKYGTMLYGLTSYDNVSNYGMVFSYKLK